MTETKFQRLAICFRGRLGQWTQEQGTPPMLTDTGNKMVGPVCELHITRLQIWHLAFVFRSGDTEHNWHPRFAALLDEASSRDACFVRAIPTASITYLIVLLAAARDLRSYCTVFNSMSSHGTCRF